MDFAPYQSSPPEHGRVASPDRITSPRASTDVNRRPFSPTLHTVGQSPPPLQHPQPQRSWAGFDDQPKKWVHEETRSSPAAPGSSIPRSHPVAEVSEFDTSLGIRLDYEACFAYLAFPPLGAILLLIMERNSDFVRLVNRFLTLCMLVNEVYEDFTHGSLPYYSLQ